MRLYLLYHTAAWRNRQTHAPQERARTYSCGFESRGRDQKQTRRLRTGPPAIYMGSTARERPARDRREPEMADEPEEKGKPEEEGADTTDWKAMARKWEARSKENADKARAYDELQEQSKTELQRVQEQAAAYKRQVEDLNAKAELDRARARVAKESGVPAELIFGADEGEMEANAKALAAWGKPSRAPRTSRPRRFSADAGDGRDAAQRELARQLFGSGE